MNKEARDRLVKLAEEAESDDRWCEFADGILDEVPDGHAGDSASHKNDGSHADLEEVAHDIEEETGHHYTVNRLRNLRATARAWPHGERDPEVEFAVHERLRGPKSKAKLASYKRQAAADYKRSPAMQGSARLTSHRLKIYRREEGKVLSWGDQQKRRARAWAKKATSRAELDGIRDAFMVALAEREKELG